LPPGNGSPSYLVRVGCRLRVRVRLRVGVRVGAGAKVRVRVRIAVAHGDPLVRLKVARGEEARLTPRRLRRAHLVRSRGVG
jgi:hypothetical protein